jgi:hypothetical protein
MAEQTGEEAKEQNIKAMGEALGVAKVFRPTQIFRAARATIE